MINIIFIFEITMKREHERENYMKGFPEVKRKSWNNAEGGVEFKKLLNT